MREDVERVDDERELSLVPDDVKLDRHLSEASRSGEGGLVGEDLLVITVRAAADQSAVRPRSYTTTFLSR